MKYGGKIFESEKDEVRVGRKTTKYNIINT